MTLANCSVTDTGTTYVVKLEGWGLDIVEWFERIICSAFPSSRYSRVGEPSDSGLLGLGKTLLLQGEPSPGGLKEVEDFLTLMTTTLTIEDSLDESHSLGYHQDEDETGGLVRSRLGAVVNQVKYGPFPHPDARAAIRRALCRFIERHPRYRRAQAIAAIPPHRTGDHASLSQSQAPDIAEQLDFGQLEIIRLQTHAPQKDIQDDDRPRGVKRRFDNQRGSMRVDCDSKGFSVIALDDLYGSGGTMAEAARALREAGAREVLGLTMTKQRLYEGVRLVTAD